MTSSESSSAGRFLVLDGVDGCGKSTQAAFLAARLGEDGREVLHLREPGSTPVGEALRGLLLDPAYDHSPGIEALLLATSRRALLEQLVGPALARGAHVVCERFHASTFAYQGYAGGLGEDFVLEFLGTWAGAPSPDLEVLLLIDPAEAERRRANLAPDRIEARGLEFQRRVDEGYRRYAERADGVCSLDASGAQEEVAAAIWTEVQRAL